MLVNTLLFYGIFLISCGITAFVFIGVKAKTALLSGGSSGLLSIGFAYMAAQKSNLAFPLAIGLTAFLIGIFAWRASKTLFALLDLTAEKHEDRNKKAIAFLIISLMAVVTLMVLFQLTTNYKDL